MSNIKPIREQIDDNKKTIEELDTKIKPLLSTRENLRDKLKIIPSTDLNLKTMKKRYKLIGEHIDEINTNKQRLIQLNKQLENSLKQQGQKQLKSKSSIPTNEDVKDDAAALGIDINKLDKTTEEELEELGEPEDFPDVPTHPIIIDNKVPPIQPQKVPDVSSTPLTPSIITQNPPPKPTRPKPTRPKPTRPKPTLPKPVTLTTITSPTFDSQEPSPSPPPSSSPPLPPSLSLPPQLLGFRETLTNPTKQPIPPLQVNPDICQTFFTNGSKVNKKYFYPSEFPKLTKIKPITVSMKKGVKRKSRKLRKNYKKYKN